MSINELTKECGCIDYADEMCLAAYGHDTQYKCTLLIEHEGEHVACGLGDMHRLQVWSA